MIRRIVKMILRRRIVSAAFIASVFAAFYWLAIASDRYVSEAHVIIQRTDLEAGQTMDFSSLLGGASGSRADQLLLRDYLLSMGMLHKLDAALHLRAHYSDSQHDLLSRMWGKDKLFEKFYLYYLGRVSIEFDDYAGVLLIKAEGYDIQTAHAITSMLVQEGELFMNSMAHNLAQDQVNFLEKQVAKMNEHVIQTRQSVLNYQNKEGLASPQATAETISGIVAKLAGQLTDLQTQRSVSQAYLVPNHPNIIQLDQQIAAVVKQIAQEQAKLTSSSGRTLNRTVDEFQRLQMEATFALDVYKTGLVALEKGRIEAVRTVKKVSLLQAPTLPEYAMEPRRFYKTLVFALVALLLAGVVHLLVAIVRDHKD
jgi:capsular polysaccharide transport system permease protein